MRSSAKMLGCVAPLMACLQFAQAADAQPTEYKNQAGPFAVESVKYGWNDATRHREVPVKIYHPKSGAGPFPILVFSHGLGGTRDGYEYLGRHWASHGYVCVHLQHIGSDDSAWRGVAQPMKSMQAAAANLTNALNRPLDVRFAIDQMTKLSQEHGAFEGRLDLGKVGVAGHSFGAYTTLAVAGQAFGLTGRTLADSRVKAAIAMSAPVPPRADRRTYSQIKIPIFHMTGTKDSSPIGETTIAERRVPFDRISNAEEFLLTFTGGDHMVFSGRVTGLQRPKDEAFQSFIKMSSTAFWDAYLKGDAAAKQWLAGGAFQAVLGDDGAFEQKQPKAVEPDRPGAPVTH